MGRIISNKVRGMNGMAKVSLVLIFTMVFGLYVYTELISAPKAEAADPASLIHNSVNTGSCSDVTFTNKADCEANSQTWTPSQRWGVNGWGISGGQYGEFVCETCHTRTTANIKRIKETITAPDGTFPGSSVIFNSAKAGSSDFGDDSNAHATSAKVCEVCHTYNATQLNGVKFHAYDMSAGGADLTHYNKTDCIACHTHNRGFKPSDCDGCHGNPPTSDLLNASSPGGNTGLADSPYVTGSAFAGAHDRHVNGMGYSNCLICHNGYSMPSNVATYTLDISFNFSGSTTGVYDGQAAVRYNAPNTNTGSLTCSSVYCHSSGQSADGTSATPVYSTPTWTGSVSCGDCHATTAMATGSHTKHLAADSNCGLCHTDATLAAYDDAKHVNKLIDVANSYTAGGAPGNGYGTCTTVCHSATTVAGVTPTWGTAGDCATCHAIIPPTGAHDKHVTSTAYSKAVCGDCHDGAVQGTTAPTPHIDNNIGVFDATPGDLGYPTTIAKHAPGTYSGTCSTTYCHSSGQSADGASATPVYASTPPSWGGAAACGSCHATTSPNFATGSHSKHLAADTNCGNCHTGATAAAYDSASHVNRQIEVANAYTAGGAPGNGYGTCTTVCHSATTVAGVTPTWGTAGDCATCHAIIPPTGAHDKHVTSTAYSKAVCGDCHDGAVQGTTAPTPHIDNNIGVFDATPGDLGYPTTIAKHAPGTYSGTCSTTYCHSSGQSADGASATPVYASTPPSWGGAAACGSCHATAAMATGSHTKHLAADTNCGLCHTDATLAAYNDAKHVNKLIDVAASLTYSADGAPGNGYGTCSTVNCHSDGAGNFATVTWGGSLGTECNGCHAFAPNTGAHAAHVQDATLLTKAYGNTEVLSTAGSYVFGCGNCHPTSAALHGNGTIELSLNPADGGTLKSKNSTSVNITGSGSTLACNLTYCHSDGSKTGDNIVAGASPQWGGAFAGDRCANCHGNSPSTAAHGMHVVGIHYYNIYTGTTGLATAGSTLASSHGNAEGSTTINCNVCHSSTVTSSANDQNTVCVTCHNGTNATLQGNAAIASKAFHVNGTADVAFVNTEIASKAQIRDSITTVLELDLYWTRNANSYKQGATPYDLSVSTLNTDAVWGGAVSKTCSNISCHNGNSATWNSTPISCGSCHTALTN